MLEGEISQINLVERLVELWREQFTGAIRFENDGIIKIIYFKGGDILSASTNDRADSIDEILMRAGKVSRDHVKQALARRKESETLGDALLNLGFITRKELTWARRVQVVGVIRSIAAWTEGSFTIVADYLPKRDEGTLFPLSQILVELIVTDQDRAKFEAALEGGTTVFQKSADFEDVFRKLGLNEDADAIVAEIDGSKTASEVATASAKDTFNAYKLLHAFATLGILRRTKPEVEPQLSLDDFAAAGVSDAADLWNERAPAAAPPAVSFTLDDSPSMSRPTLELPSVSFDDPRMVRPATHPDVPIPEAPSPSAWEETDEIAIDTAIGDQPLSRDLIDAPLMPPSAPETPASPEPAIPTDDRARDLDEKPIESQRAATPPPPAPRVARTPALSVAQPKKSRSGGVLIALVLLAILGAAGYYGYSWWQSRSTTETTAPAATASPVPATVTEPTTIVDVPTETTATSTASATTTAGAAVPPESTPATPPPLSITPDSPVATAVAAPEAGRERYDAMAREHLANATGKYTVQIQILCDPANLQKAIDAGGSNVWFVPQPIGSRSCYRVLWGRFETRDEASAALAQVPRDIRDASAAVKPVPR